MTTKLARFFWFHIPIFGIEWYSFIFAHFVIGLIWPNHLRDTLKLVDENQTKNENQKHFSNDIGCHQNGKADFHQQIMYKVYIVPAGEISGFRKINGNLIKNLPIPPHYSHHRTKKSDVINDVVDGRNEYNLSN